MIYEKNILNLATVNPFPICEIQPIYDRCKSWYFTEKKALEKCQSILDTARELGISTSEAMDLQLSIDGILWEVWR